MVIAGVDEAGRGPLAGPVVAAAVILPEGFDPEGIDDSKKLDAAKRETLALRIKQQAIWAIGIAEVGEIDSINILWATMAAMERAILNLSVLPDRVLIDGNRLPRNLPCPGEAIVDGDAKVLAISAASIIAKTTRDRMMGELDEAFPLYGFAKHFGYSTPQHMAALKLHGPCALHRMTFAPCQPEKQLCLFPEGD